MSRDELSQLRLIVRIAALLLALTVAAAPVSGYEPPSELGAGELLLRPEGTVETPEGPVREVVFYTKLYTIDRLYRSMQGPYSMVSIPLGAPGEPPELVWLKSIESEVVDAQGKPGVSQQFMCHVNVNYDVGAHNQLFGSSGNRIVTLSQGQYDTAMPPGFGVPLASTEGLKVDTMVLNHNFAEGRFDVRHRLTIRYIRDRDLQRPLQPLYQTVATAKTLRQGGETFFGELKTGENGESMSCLPGEHAAELVTDQFGRQISGHWVVKPGRQVLENLVTRDLAFRFDTTLHAIDVHLHPFAESIELRDMTTGESLFKSVATQVEEGVGLAKVETYRSSEGIPVFKDHEYGLVTVYDNPTEEDHDAMAVLYVHALDESFDRERVKRSLAALSGPETTAMGVDERIVLNTTMGSITVRPYVSTAPETLAQLKKLIGLGVYDTTRFHRLEPGFLVQLATADDRLRPLTPDQTAAIRKLPAELGPVASKRGTVGMARWDDDPDSAETSFYILLGPARHLDGGYTYFGEVERGWEVLDAIEKLERRPGSTEPAERLGLVSAEVVMSDSKQIQPASAPVELPQGSDSEVEIE